MGLLQGRVKSGLHSQPIFARGSQLEFCRNWVCLRSQDDLGIGGWSLGGAERVHPGDGDPQALVCSCLWRKFFSDEGDPLDLRELGLVFFSRLRI